MDGPEVKPEVKPGEMRVFPRRRLLRDAALATSGAVAIGLAGPVPATLADVRRLRAGARLGLFPRPNPAATGSYEPVALTSAELGTLNAVLARLIPADDLGPGAVEAGVFVYIDQELAGYYTALLPAYQAQLALLDATAVADGAASFAALAPERQDEVLTQLQAGELAAPQGSNLVAQPEAGDPAAGAQFFAALLSMTAEGMFGDPVYGGNANYAGWDLIGYPGVKLVWTEEEQAIGTELTPEHQSVADFGGSAFR